MPRLSVVVLLAVVLAALSLVPAAAAAAPKCSSHGWTTQGKLRKYTQYDAAAADIAANGGWKKLPGSKAVCGAQLLRDAFVVNSQGLTQPLYVSQLADNSAVQRIVITVPAKGRDGWMYFTSIYNALQKAGATYADIDKKKIAIISTQYMNQADADAGSARATDLLFDDVSWSDGAQGRANAGGGAQLGGDQISSYEVLDKLIVWAQQRYPNAKRVVVAGHSLGGQAVNRYSVLRKEQLDAVPVYFVAGNPASWLWMETSRPRPDANCPGVDDYKFGLSAGMVPYGMADLLRLGRDGMLRRFAGRNVVLALGDKDYGAGDPSCQASVQGRSHRNRGMLFVRSITKLLGAFPAKWSYDQVSGCSHDPMCMWASELGMLRLFRDGYPGASTRVSKNASAARRRNELDEEEQ